MSRAARFFWVCGISAALCAVTVVVLSKTTLEPEGFTIFDSRVLGYDGDYARAYLAALSEAQVQTYLGSFRRLDTALPVLLALSLFGAIWLNTQGVARALILAPLAYLAADLAENGTVALILRAGEGASDSVVAQASLLTQLKWGCLVVSAIDALVCWRARRAMA